MRVKCNSIECDYAIIGAGTGGIATADALAARFPGSCIALFEAQPRPGGRVRSRTLDPDGADDLAVIEFGAGRYHPGRHCRVSDMIDRLGIATRPFCFEMVRNTPGAREFAADATLARLHHLRGAVQADASFRSVVEADLGPAGFETLVELSGYDTLRRDELPFAHGLEIISAHPETEAIWTGGAGGWRTISLGFRQLPERLAEQLNGRARIYFNHRVTRLMRDGRAVVGLEAIGPCGIVKARCRQVLCATPLHDLLALSPPARAVIDYEAQVVDVSLVKGFLEFERAFWPQGGSELGHCVVTSSPFRKLYFSASRPRTFFYCDGAAADRLTGMLAHETLPDRFLRELPTIMPSADPAQVVATRWGVQHWTRGISFWAGGRQPVEGPIWTPEPGLAFLSDINTPELGWLEGTLLAAEAVEEHVAPPSPYHPRTALPLEPAHSRL